MKTSRSPILLVAVLLSAMTPGCSRTPSFEGHWVGMLNEGTDSLRRFDVDIARFRGRWIAEVDDDRGVTDYPVGIDVPSRSDVILTLRPGITFRGRLANSRRALDGELTLGEFRAPLVMTREGQAEISQVRIEFESLPPGTNRLAVLSPGSEELKRDFNRDRSKVRLVALLSPT
jgi:hypothetical protein